MGTDLDEQTDLPDSQSDSGNPGQQHTNDVFNQLTSAEHMAKNGGGGDTGGGGGEQSFGNPNGGGKDISNKLASPSQLNGAEAAAGLAGVAAGGLYNALPDGVNPLKQFFGGHKKSIAGTAIGLFMTGATFLGFSVASGPLQFIHLSQLLQHFHMTEQSDDADDRLGKLERFYRYARTGDVTQTRLGIFANTYANHIETKLNASGIESSYDKYGRFKGYIIDPENDNWKGMSNDEIKAQLKAEYGISTNATSLDSGKVLINTDKTGFFAQRKMIGGMLEQAGYKGISGAIQARLMTKRAGLTWHPIKKLDNKVKSKVADIWEATKNQFTSDIEEGASDGPITTSGEDDPDAKDKSKAGTDQQAQQNSNTSSETNKILQDVPDAETGSPKAVASLKAKITAGAAGSALGVLGVGCLIKSLDDSAAAVKYAQTIVPLMRLGASFVSMGSQAQYGGQGNPNYMQEMGYFSEKYFNSNQKGNTGSWAAGQSIEAEEGKSGGVAPDKTLTTLQSGSPLDFIKSVPGLGAACSGFGQVVQAVVGVFLAPVSFAFGLALSTAIQATGVLDDVVKALAGKAIDVNAASIAGPQFGNYVNFGTKILADNQFVGAGAGKLTTAQHTQLAEEDQAEAKQDFESHDVAYRIFSPDTSQSLVGSLIDAQNPRVFANLNQTANSFLNFGSALMSLPSKIFSSVAHAAPTTPYDYGGLPTYGFSEAEMSDPNLDNPYANANYVIQHGLLASDADKIKQCFGVTVSADGSQLDATTGLQVSGSATTNNIYSGDYDNMNCTDSGNEDWLRVRMYVFDSETADSMGCYEGDAQGCQDIGFEDAGNTDTSGTTDSGPTGNPVKATGTAAQLATQLLGEWGKNLTGTDYAKSDLQRTSEGKTINNSSSCGNTVSINADLLQVLLTASGKYKLNLDNIISGHGCDQFLHPKGRASDIGGVTDIATGKSTNFCAPSSDAEYAPRGCDQSQDNQQLDHNFYVYMASIMPKGSEMGQHTCQGRSNVTAPAGIDFFGDFCDHQHIDLGDGN